MQHERGSASSQRQRSVADVASCAEQKATHTMISPQEGRSETWHYPPRNRGEPPPIPSGLVVIARNVTGQIVTRITSHRDLMGAIHTARSVLPLKPGAVRVEVHHGESLTSNYDGKPLAVVSHDDLLVDQR